jgi:hypothetical protein
MKNAVFWNVTQWALVRTDISEAFKVSIIMVTKIKLGTTIDVTGNRRRL